MSFFLSSEIPKKILNSDSLLHVKFNSLNKTLPLWLLFFFFFNANKNDIFGKQNIGIHD